jgi:hypothetical protein
VEGDQDEHEALLEGVEGGRARGSASPSLQEEHLTRGVFPFSFDAEEIDP